MGAEPSFSGAAGYTDPCHGCGVHNREHVDDICFRAKTLSTAEIAAIEEAITSREELKRRRERAVAVHKARRMIL